MSDLQQSPPRESLGLRGTTSRVYPRRAITTAGPDTPELKAGTWYEEWVPNDHA